VLRQFRDVDKGYDALMKRLVELANPQVRVGVHAAEGQRREAGIRLAKKEGKFHLRGRGGARPVTVLDVATWAEFGIGQPMRSWLRAWYDGGRQQNFADIQKMMVRVLAGKVPLNRALEQLGQRFVGLIQRRLRQRDMRVDQRLLVVKLLQVRLIALHRVDDAIADAPGLDQRGAQRVESRHARRGNAPATRNTAAVGRGALLILVDFDRH
jgi:hypothetical protein